MFCLVIVIIMIVIIMIVIIMIVIIMIVIVKVFCVVPIRQDFSPCRLAKNQFLPICAIFFLLRGKILMNLVSQNLAHIHHHHPSILIFTMFFLLLILTIIGLIVCEEEGINSAWVGRARRAKALLSS